MWSSLSGLLTGVLGQIVFISEKQVAEAAPLFYCPKPVCLVGFTVLHVGFTSVFMKPFGKKCYIIARTLSKPNSESQVSRKLHFVYNNFTVKHRIFPTDLIK